MEAAVTSIFAPHDDNGIEEKGKPDKGVVWFFHKGSLYTFLFSEGKVGQERESDDISKELSTR